MNGVLILDASVAVKAVLPNPLQGHCLALIQTFADVQPAAPALWAHGTTSAIAKATHFGEITKDEGRWAIDKLNALGVRLFVPDPTQNLAAFEWTLRLQRASAYDSYYLALAEALECDYWTADKRLFNGLQDARLGWMHWIEELPPLNA
ncbi:MAG: type II toxin-antitoxin system VapC family toxin [Anaerolineales bacterium]|nr:type II toxin-antitoxin system VapC family toxin [Anaerolineales bacterium]